MARTEIVSCRPTPCLEVCNRQKTRRLNLALVRQLMRRLWEEGPRPLQPGGTKAGLPAAGSLGVNFIQADEMARLNAQFLGHDGSTDVLAFDYQQDGPAGGWNGEIFVSVDDAVASAPRYGATWQSELARYLVHGMLHLRGYDDRLPAARREMKKEENRLLKSLSRRFDWGKLERRNNGTRRK